MSGLESSGCRGAPPGTAVIYQQPAQFRHLSVTENIAVAREGGAGWRTINWRRRRQWAEKILEELGEQIDPDREVDTLSMPEQQLVEIAKALSADAKILIMDEPTASLTEPEVKRLFNAIATLRGSGAGIIYISPAGRDPRDCRIASPCCVTPDCRHPRAPGISQTPI